MVMTKEELELLLELIGRQPILPMAQQQVILNLQRRAIVHLERLADQRCIDFRRGAIERWGQDDMVEIDAGATVCEDEGRGAYVQAWLWISCEEAGLPSKRDAEEAREEPEGVPG